MVPFAGVNVDNLLLAGMKTAAANHSVIANNLANVDTPGFSATELDFERTLREMLEGRGGIELRTSRPRHFDFETHRPQFERIAFLSKNDYNKVDLDDQITKLRMNTGKYTMYARLLSKRFEMSKNMLSALAR